MTDDQLIEDYLLGKLSSGERQAFQKRLEQEPILASQVETMKNILEQLKRAGRERFEKGKQEAIDKLTKQSFFSQLQEGKEEEEIVTEEELAAFRQIGKERFANGLEQAQAKLEAQGFFEQLEKKKGRVRRLWILGMAIAAALVLLVILMPSIYQNSHREMYNSAFAIDTERVERVVQQMGFVRNQDNQFEAAVRAAEAENYEEATLLVDSFLNAQPIPFLRQYGEFLAAMLHMEAGKMDAAQALLVPLAEDEDFHDQAAATWFVGLIYLKNGELERAQQILEGVPETSNYFEPAQDLIERLKS